MILDVCRYDCKIVQCYCRENFFKYIAQPGNIVSSVGSIAQYTISSFVSFFVLVPFNRL